MKKKKHHTFVDENKLKVRDDYNTTTTAFSLLWKSISPVVTWGKCLNKLLVVGSYVF